MTQPFKSSSLLCISHSFSNPAWRLAICGAFCLAASASAYAQISSYAPGSRRESQQTQMLLESSDAVKPPADAKPAAAVELITSESRPPAFFFGPVPRTQITAQDATLNNICQVGDHCWAVGERGVVCHSDDGGDSWVSQFVPYECSLHSVCFLSGKHGWIAGTQYSQQRGGHRKAVLLQTRDGGITWTDLVAESEQNIRHADQMSRTVNLPVSQISGILKIQYFGLEEAVAVTLPGESRSQGTLYRSTDGGMTWSPISSDSPQARWTTGAFLSSTEGLVAGEQLAHATLVADQAVVIGQPAATLRQIRSVSANMDGSAWMAGDGTFLLTTRNAGVSWQSIIPSIPARVRQMLDLHAVAHSGSTVIAAGAPASCLLRTKDNGASWQIIMTPLNGEIRQLLYTGDGRLLALGSMGAIARSEDDGVSWTCVRSGDHRSGLMNFVTELQATSFELLAKSSADDGVRTVVVQLSPDDSRMTTSAAQADSLSRLSMTQAQVTAQHALNQLAANTLTTEWMFPRNRPQHHLSAGQLIAEWNRQTDGELRDLLPLRIARLIRTWKPTVIAVEPMSFDDSVASLTKDILPTAIQMAASDDYIHETGFGHASGIGKGIEESIHTNSLAALGLEPWTVQRVVIKCSPERTSPMMFSKDDILSSPGTTNGLLTRFAMEEFTVLSANSQRMQRADRACYETLVISGGAGSGTSDNATKSAELISVTRPGLFDGLQQFLGSDARRAVDRLSREELQQMQQAATASQLERSALQGHLKLSTLQNAFESELQNIGQRLPPALALQQLLDLAVLNKESNNIDGWIAVQQEIIRRFPDSLEATGAAKFLFSYYSSAEIRKYRVTEMQSRSAARAQLARSATNMVPSGFGAPGFGASGSRTTEAGANHVEGVFPQASLPFDSTPSTPIPNLVVPAAGFVTTPEIQQATGVTFGPNASDHGQTLLTSWDRQAASAMQILTTNLGRDMPSAVILRQAANFRLANRSGEQSTLLAEITGRGDAWADFAQAEAQAVHGVSTPVLPIFNLRKSVERPWLDAALADECWVQADEIRLTNTDADNRQDQPASLVMLSWDDEFLYVAGRFEHQNGGPDRQPVVTNRTHDAVHAARDRFELKLDVDRDYATAFVFCVDQTGETSERCDLLTDWNPKWYAAVESDSTTWRIELAIPLNSLDLKQTKAGDLWTVHMVRTLPGYFEHAIHKSFTQSKDGTEIGQMDSSTTPSTTDTALIRFIRTNRKKN